MDLRWTVYLSQSDSFLKFQNVFAINFIIKLICTTSVLKISEKTIRAPLIFAHPWCANFPPLIFARPKCAKFKGAQKFKGIRYIINLGRSKLKGFNYYIINLGGPKLKGSNFYIINLGGPKLKGLYFKI